MKIELKIAEELKKGVECLAEEKNVELGEGGYVLEGVKCGEPTLRVALDGKKITVRYCEKCQFFRAFGLALQHIEEGEKAFDIVEHPSFTMNGVMFDLSQGNAAFNQKASKSVIRKMALMGLNTLMFYLEDNYEVDGQPYFGYMRPIYKQSELKELDDYAYDLGIEMIPCIQILAHLPDALRWNVYSDIRDYEECLLVGEPKTYKFIEDLITSAVKPFRTKRINVCMDEAFKLGSGQYLRKYGYKTTGEIMKEHLAKVSEILDRHGLKPMMWSDMYFHTFGNGSYHEPNCYAPQSTKDLIPKNMSLIFWDYSYLSKEHEELLDINLDLCERTVFAGGCWAWLGYGLSYFHTIKHSVDALELCRKHGLKEVFMTTWGDNGTEALQNVNLVGAQVYAECGYNETFDQKAFESRLKFCTGGNAADFELMDALDRSPYALQYTPNYSINTTKFAMWQDILTGLYDKNLEGLEMDRHYEELTKKLEGSDRRNGEFNGLFGINYNVANVLALKSEMGLRLRKAYLDGDKETLKKIACEELPELCNRVFALHEAHREAWFEIYKPTGWDIMDMRYGSLESRIRSAEIQVKAYLDGKLDSIEELEKERLPYNGVTGPLKWQNFYGDIVSASRIAPKA